MTKKIYSRNYKKISDDIFVSKYPYSCKALLYLDKKVENLLIAIEPLQVKDYYSSQVILRVVFEHFLLGHYIWTKCRIDKNDNCGKEYYFDYSVSEFLKRLSYDLKIDSIQNKEPKVDLLTQFKKDFPQYPEANQEDLDKIHRVASQFDVRRILDYILNTVPSVDFFGEFHSVFHHFLRDYNKLSSFVHTGPSAENESFHDIPIIDKEKKIIENLGWAKTASRLIKFYILMTLLEQDAFKEFYRNEIAPLRIYLEQAD